MEQQVTKKGLSEETKAKLVYSGEIGIIAIVFLVLGILRLTGLRGYNHVARMIFNIVTTAGAIYGIYNFISYYVSSKKRAKTSLVDIWTVLPITLFLIGFNTYCYIVVFPLSEAQVTESIKEICKYCMGGLLVYAGITFLFQAIYHYFKPIPLLYQILKEEEEEKKLEEQKALENNPIDNKEE